MHGRHSREKQWAVGALFRGSRRFLSSPRRATLVATALLVPVLVAGGLSLLPAAPRRPAPSRAVPLPPSLAASRPQPVATPDLTLRARTQMAEPVKKVPHRRKATSAPAPAPRPTAAPPDPVVCFRWWYRIWCIRPHDGARHRRDRYPPYDGGPYGSRPRW